ncbi:MAG: hypothetical protein EBU34_12245 [Alphaproteobacteria bacterium]|nr:hypothetical protein [Alphaproteobacteria bacterium]
MNQANGKLEHEVTQLERALPLNQKSDVSQSLKLIFGLCLCNESQQVLYQNETACRQIALMREVKCRDQAFKVL